jgi:hypothetical protein
MYWKQNQRREALTTADVQQAVTRCSCGWYFRGLVRDGKAAFRAHREMEHGKRAAA